MSGQHAAVAARKSVDELSLPPETLDLMPDLDATLHVKMAPPKKKRRVLPRIIAAIKREIAAPNIYGLQWGNPDVVRPLRFIRDRYVLPYVSPEHAAVEIGRGGRALDEVSTRFQEAICGRLSCGASGGAEEKFARAEDGIHQE